jgi:acyl-CoA thioesterase I
MLFRCPRLTAIPNESPPEAGGASPGLWRARRKQCAVPLCVLVCTLGVTHIAVAQIVALGASNTEGKGVDRSAAYPARLEALLNARGLTIKVTNAGVRGQTVAQMLSGLDAAVPDGTRLVIFQPGNNDIRNGVPWPTVRANIHSVVQRLRARGIRVLVVRDADFEHIPADMRQSDHIHLTAAGYQRLAEELLPRVLNALKEP